MNTFTYLFIAFLAASVLTRYWLSYRHLRAIHEHRDAVPDAFRDNISLADHQKAADYTSAGVRLGRWDLALETLVLLAWTLGGGLQWLDSLWREAGFSALLTGIAVILSVMLIGMLIDLPMSWYQTFVHEEKFGFNRTTPKLFFTDLVKQLLVTLILGVPLLLGILWFLQNAGPLWWLYAWALWFGFSMTLMWAYPVFIAPLFNKFTALEAGEVRSRIEALLQRNGLNADGIFVMDGSKRSGHGNAYFTGFGANKRIVFFDTLLENLGGDEIEAVLAHEVGHFKRKHIVKRLITMSLLSLGGLALLGYLANSAWFYQGLGVTHQAGYLALVLFMLVMPVFTFLLQPVSAWFSRKHEFEADEFAAQESDAATLIKALVKLYQENAATLTPDPLYSAFHDSHPPAPVRVAHLNTLSH